MDPHQVHLESVFSTVGQRRILETTVPYSAVYGRFCLRLDVEAI